MKADEILRLNQVSGDPKSTQDPPKERGHAVVSEEPETLPDFDLSEGKLEDRLRELVALGVVSGKVTGRPPLKPFEPIQSRGGSLSEAIVEDREDRF